jgi:tetratricopeptide (TPR) repeat protein
MSRPTPSPDESGRPPVVAAQHAQGVQIGTDNTQVNIFPVRPWQAERPRQLPAAVPHFAGRSAAMAALTDLIRGPDEAGGTVVISAIGGTAGVGKTALAVHWAHQVADRFPDGQLYLNLRGFDPGGQVMAPAEAVRRFLDALNVPAERIPDDLDAQAALYRSQLAGRRMLVVLDNARDAAQVRPLLPGTPGCLVLVTSRNQIPGLVAAEGADPITLDLFTPAEARDLLARRLDPGRIAAEPAAVADICAACAGLPLALSIVAARAATHPRLSLQAIAVDLRDAGARLDTLATGDPHTDPRMVFSWSYRALTPGAARLFRLLGLHPGPDISVAAAASLAATSPAQVRTLLSELVGANLLAEHGPGRYVLHDLLRAYAAEYALRVDAAGRRRAAVGRLLDSYAHTAFRAARLLSPARDPIHLEAPRRGVTVPDLADYEAALDWFRTEHAGLLASVDQAADSGDDRHTWQLAWALVDHLDRQGHRHALAATQRAAVVATQRLGDVNAQARAHHLLANAYTRLGDHDDAASHLRQALDLYRRSGDLAGQANVHHCLGNLLDQRGGPAAALGHARQALDLYLAAGDRTGQAHVLNAFGWYHAQLGNHDQALARCAQALALFRDLEDRQGLADTWDTLGRIHQGRGDYARAIVCSQHAVHLLQDLRSRYDEADTLRHLGDSLDAIGNRPAARDAWRRALTVLERLDHPDADQVRARLEAHDTGPGASPPDGNRGGDRVAEPNDERVADVGRHPLIRGVGQDDVADTQVGVPAERGGDVVG